MIKVGKWIAKHKILIIIIGIALLIPSYLGMAATRINYDVLSYLPDTLETVDGQDIMVDQFGMGAFSMIVVEDMELKDVAALKEKIEAVDHVKKVLWYDSVLDVSVPVEMLPKDLREAFFNGDATMMIALFDNTTSSETSMEAVTQIRKITSKNCFVSGMTGIVTDIKQIALKEQISEEIYGMAERDENGIFSYYVESKAENRDDFYSTFGGLLFLGIILSAVFIFAAVLIIYYKQISEGYEDETRFGIMQKIGMTNREIRQSINSQLLTVFFLPLIGAGIHLAFAFPMVRKLLLMFNLNNVPLFVFTVIASFAVFTLFYIVVYRITSNSYYSIVTGAKKE